MTFRGTPAELTNWSKSAHSSCLVYQPHDSAGIGKALAVARTCGLSVLPHGAGHSYTDAALNTGGVVIDLKPMRRMLSWDAAQGIIRVSAILKEDASKVRERASLKRSLSLFMHPPRHLSETLIMRVEPGVTLGEMVQVAWKDGWWPAVSPSTPAVTIGGCAAMNVNGKNAWKCGPFGEHIRAIDVMLASGDLCTLTPERDAPLFHAFIGSMGLLGIITSITVQLQHINSGRVTIRRRLTPHSPSYSAFLLRNSRRAIS